MHVRQVERQSAVTCGNRFDVDVKKRAVGSHGSARSGGQRKKDQAVLIDRLRQRWRCFRVCEKFAQQNRIDLQHLWIESKSNERHTKLRI